MNNRDFSETRVVSLLIGGLQCITGEEDARNHSRNDDQPQWEELEVTGQNAASFSMGVVLGRQCSLNNHLFTANTRQRSCHDGMPGPPLPFPR